MASTGKVVNDVDMFPPTDSTKNVVDMFPRTDGLKDIHSVISSHVECQVRYVWQQNHLVWLQNSSCCGYGK
jgi:hypothetical protein